MTMCPNYSMLQELEIQRVKLLQDVTTYKEMYKTLEENLLKSLLAADVCIVDHSDFIAVCKETKVKQLCTEQSTQRTVCED